jgi:hypothetical protein
MTRSSWIVLPMLAATCVGMWGGCASSSSSAQGGNPSQCPLLDPNDGDPCETPGLVCETWQCTLPTMECSNGSWTIVSVGAETSCFGCGNITCAGPCVELKGPEKSGFYCTASACIGETLNCGCAGSLCLGNRCSVSDGQATVTCGPT